MSTVTITDLARENVRNLNRISQRVVWVVTAMSG